MKISLRALISKIKSSGHWFKIINYINIISWLVFISIILFIVFVLYKDVYQVIIAPPDTGRVAKDFAALKLKKDEFEIVRKELADRPARIINETAKEFINPFSRY